MEESNIPFPGVTKKMLQEGVHVDVTLNAGDGAPLYLGNEVSCDLGDVQEQHEGTEDVGGGVARHEAGGDKTVPAGSILRVRRN
jgi:hypothetical protein